MNIMQRINNYAKRIISGDYKGVAAELITLCTEECAVLTGHLVVNLQAQRYEWPKEAFLRALERKLEEAEDKAKMDDYGDDEGLRMRLKGQ